MKKDPRDYTLKVIIKMMANMVYGFNGSDKSNPKISKEGIEHALATLKENLPLLGYRDTGVIGSEKYN